MSDIRKILFAALHLPKKILMYFLFQWARAMPRIFLAPARRKVFRASLKVAPVVATSSTTIMLRPRGLSLTAKAPRRFFRRLALVHIRRNLGFSHSRRGTQNFTIANATLVIRCSLSGDGLVDYYRLCSSYSKYDRRHAMAFSCRRFVIRCRLSIFCS